jgi:hypothetical protein
MKILYLVFFKNIRLKNKKYLLFLNVLRPFSNWFYHFTLYIYFKSIFNVKSGDLHAKVFSFCIQPYSCIIAG